MSCNRLYGGQKKNKQQSKQASQRKSSGGDPDGSSTVAEGVEATEDVVEEAVKPTEEKSVVEPAPADAASTEEKSVAPAASTEVKPVEPAPAATAAPASNSWFSSFFSGKTGGKRRTQRKQRNQRKTQKAGSQKTVIGRLYSKTCVHCVAMQDAWKQLQKMLKQHGGNILMKDVEAGKMDQQLPQVNQQFLGGSDQKVALQGGFPTLFKIKNNKVEYYGGERTADAMYNWALQ
jgi:hypothetical protein